MHILALAQSVRHIGLDWIDDISLEDEEDMIIKAIIFPDQSGKTCWYWLDLIVNGVDEVDR